MLNTLLDKYEPYFLALRSPEQHKRYKRNWSARFGLRAVESIKPGELEAYRRELLARLAVASVNREFAFLRRVFSLAQRDGLVASSPADNVRQLRENNQRCRWLTAEEEAKLLETTVSGRGRIPRFHGPSINAVKNYNWHPV